MGIQKRGSIDWLSVYWRNIGESCNSSQVKIIQHGLYLPAFNNNLFIHFYSCGGNMLMNVGPTHDGRIVPVFEERLLQLGILI